MEYAIMDTPALYLESLISDTWENKIDWISYKYDYGIRHWALVMIPTTMKYLKIEIYDMGQATFIETEFHTGIEINKTIFNTLDVNKQPERLTRLLLAIKRYMESNNKKILDKKKIK